MYRVDYDHQSKYYYVYPSNFSEGVKWAVYFENSQDAEAYKIALMGGKLKTPYEAPHYYSQTGKYFQGKYMVYSYSYKNNPSFQFTYTHKESKYTGKK